MKKTRKILSLALAVAISGSMLPGNMVNAATAESKNADPYEGIKGVTSKYIEDFEGFEVGTKWTADADGASKTSNITSYIAVRVNGAGNSAEIVEDNGTKALKITYTGTGRVDIYNYFTSSHSNNVTDQIIRAGAKVRFERFTEEANITGFNKLYNQSKGSQMAMVVGAKGEEVWINAYSDKGKRAFKGLSSYRDKYFSIASTYNRTTKLGTVEAPSGVVTWQGANNYAFQAAEFTVTTAKDNLKGFDSAKDANGNKVNTVLYIDDIFSERVSYEVSGIYVGDVIEAGKGLENVPLNAPVNVKFTGEIPDMNYEEYITLTNSTGEAVQFVATKDSENTLTVFPQGQDVSETYTLTVPAGITAPFNPSFTTTKAATVTYKTCADGFSFMGYIDNLSFNEYEEKAYSQEGSGYFLDKKIRVHANVKGDSVSIATDPITKSKALKLTRDIGNVNIGMSKYNYVFDKAYDSGKIVVKFDTRIANDNGGTTSFISFSDDKTTGSTSQWQNALYNGYWWASFMGNNEQWANGSQHWNKDTYFPARMYIDFTTNKFGGTVYREKTNLYLSKEKAFSNTVETYTSNVKYMNLVDFRDTNVNSTVTADSEIYIDNLKVAYYDYKKLGVDAVSKPETGADISGEIVLTMNDEVVDEDVTTANFSVTDSDENPISGYTVKKDGVKVIITVPNGLSYETPYFVKVNAGIRTATSGIMAMDKPYVYGFETGAYSKYIFEDNFTDIELGTTWAGPQTVEIGNVKVTLEEGDSLEFATDAETGKNGFKLTKGSATGNLQFKYIFDKGYENGKYRVYVDSRIENWSKAHNQWPALLNEEESAAYSAATRITGSYYLGKSGKYGTDRYGYDWSAQNDGRWIEAYDTNKNYQVVGELTTGAGYTYGFYDPATKVMRMSKIEPATSGTVLGGVLMNINGGETDYSKGIYKGTQNSEDGVAWIYGVAVEKLMLDVTETSFVNGADGFDVEEEVVISCNLRLDESTVTKDNVKFYKEGVLVDDYAVTVSENKKSIVITPAEGLKLKTNYSITVDGVWAYDAVSGKIVLRNYSFKTIKPEDFVADEIEVITGGIKSVLYNNTESDSSFVVIGVGKDSDGNITEIKIGSKGTVSAESHTDVSVELNAAHSYEMYVWDGLTTMMPLVKKKIADGLVNETNTVFAVGSKRVIKDGEVVEETYAPYEGSDGIYIPSELASKYFAVTNKDISVTEVEKLGIDVYVNEELGLVALGNAGVGDDNAEKTIRKFGIYVSPEGSDENTGYANAPVKTINRAKAVYENDYKSTIFVHGGDYRETLAITAKHQGMEIVGFGDGEAKLLGSVSLPASEFTAVSGDAANKIPESARAYVKEIDLSEYVSEDMPAYPEYKPQQQSKSYYELFVDDEAKTIARWPNEGFSTTGIVMGNSFTAPSGKGSLWKNSKNGMIAGYFKYDWAFENIKIGSSMINSFITLENEPAYGLETGKRFYAMNMLEELDVAGEYYIDNEAKKLYYYPEGGILTSDPELSVMTDDIISLSHAYDIKLKGITVANTRGDGITVLGGGNVTIDGCVIRNIGRGGIEVENANKVIENCHIYSIGGTAVRITAGSNEKLTEGNVVVRNNKIHDFGRIFRTYQGAVNINGCGNTVSNNTIYDAPHCAIRFTGSNHNITNNEIYNVVYESSDAGAIYAGRTWTTWGNTIKNNYFHDIVRAEGLEENAVAAVYCDDQLTGTVVEENVFENCYKPAIFGGGVGNVFKNNIASDCETGIQYDDRGRTHQADTVVPDSKDSDNQYEEFVKFLANSSVIETMDYRKENFNGFSILVSDVESYQKDSSYAMGYPKGAVITGNAFYGKNAVKSDYESISEDVRTYGTISGNVYKEVAEAYNKPQCGAASF